MIKIISMKFGDSLPPPTALNLLPVAAPHPNVSQGVRRNKLFALSAPERTDLKTVKSFIVQLINSPCTRTNCLTVSSIEVTTTLPSSHHMYIFSRP